MGFFFLSGSAKRIECMFMEGVYRSGVVFIDPAVICQRKREEKRRERKRRDLYG
jgi:hypothetical protein